MLRLLIFAGLLSMVTSVSTLSAQVQNLVVKADHKTPADFFSELSLQSGINIIYSDNIIEKLPPITLELKGVSVDEIMTKILDGSQVGFKYIDHRIILY